MAKAKVLVPIVMLSPNSKISGHLRLSRVAAEYNNEVFRASRAKDKKGHFRLS